MTPKEKAVDLWLTYYERLPDSVFSNESAKQEAKQLALITVDEIVKYKPREPMDYTDTKGWWKEVKREIEAL